MNEPRTSSLLVGIFVGGRGARMGGAAKGLLTAPGTSLTLLERTLLELEAALPGIEIVLVGSATEYAHVGLAVVNDAPPGIGPLGGLLGLLEHAERKAYSKVLALACDLPFLRRELLARLAREAEDVAALVTVQRLIRNPLVARYSVFETMSAARASMAEGAHSLQAVLDRLGDRVLALQLTADEQASLEDWDTPDDVRDKR